MGEYNVKRLIPPEIEIEGVLRIDQHQVVFEPEEEEALTVEIPLTKVKDVRFTTESEISWVKTGVLGAMWGALWKNKHNLLLIDFEGERGIMEHLFLEGDRYLVDAEYEIRG